LSHPTHPTPPVTDHEREVPVSAGQQEDDEVAVPVCAQDHERYCPTPPHRTPANNDESAVAMPRMRDDEGAQVSDILLTGCASE